MSHPIHIVDVFAEEPYSGNQLAVVFDAGNLSTETMQAVAAETNFSETTFVVGSECDLAAPVSVRIFTPRRELRFAGHPTLGTAWILRHVLSGGAAGEMVLALGVGDVRVAFDDDGVPWFEAPPVTIAEAVDPDLIAASLGLATDAVDTAIAPHVVDIGFRLVVCLLRDRSAVATARLTEIGLRVLGEELGVESIQVADASALADGGEAEVRFFFDAQGIREDPATGSAAACLGGFLARRGLLGESFRLDLLQGARIGRPSRIHLRRADQVTHVGGVVRHAIRGELL